MGPVLTKARRGRLEPKQYIDGILERDRTVLARAVTVIESERDEDADLAAAILEGVLPYSGKARRVGVTGLPGAGKSTFIDKLGVHLVRDCGEKVAVLTVDPSSPVSGGSILGDKTRMENLSAEENAFIRPSPARGHLGGVTRKTRETILLCEAAGYENVLVETVGVGQSETAVRSMTDFFLLITIAGAGDELQGIKRGILEMIDAMAINKADGDNEQRAERARVEYRNALHLFSASPDGWSPKVLAISALTGKGIAEVWKLILQHRAELTANGFLAKRRSRQALDWMRELVSTGLEQLLRKDQAAADLLPRLETAVENGEMTPSVAARRLLTVLTSKDR
ncbi:MAG: methylmalonyl Co-A mutase-associated GTPase MeaB [Acidobacteriaceae bacterium]|nr:methylmalonyl Co-A mutase-associated GTPase MeaB [Acidobacteriaceae bacterium]